MSLFYSVVRTTNSLVSLNMRSYHDNKGYCCLLVTSLIANKISTSFVDIFPRTIAGAFFFSTPKEGNYSSEGDYSRETIISNIAL